MMLWLRRGARGKQPALWWHRPSDASCGGAPSWSQHVGLANFQLFLKNISSMLHDDGLFYMQVAGLRKGSNWQDTQWGLFMSRYIFPGADASTKGRKGASAAMRPMGKLRGTSSTLYQFMCKDLYTRLNQHTWVAYMMHARLRSSAA